MVLSRQKTMSSPRPTWCKRRPGHGPPIWGSDQVCWLNSFVSSDSQEPRTPQSRCSTKADTGVRCCVLTSHCYCSAGGKLPDEPRFWWLSTELGLTKIKGFKSKQQTCTTQTHAKFKAKMDRFCPRACISCASLYNSFVSALKAVCLWPVGSLCRCQKNGRDLSRDDVWNPSGNRCRHLKMWRCACSFGPENSWLTSGKSLALTTWNIESPLRTLRLDSKSCSKNCSLVLTKKPC